MAAVVLIVQLVAGLGSFAVILVRFGLLSWVVGLVQGRVTVTCKPCPRCQALVPVSRRGSSVLGLKVQCPHCDARLLCSRRTKR